MGCIRMQLYSGIIANLKRVSNEPNAQQQWKDQDRSTKDAGEMPPILIWKMSG